jgi:hypothetical protein
MSSSNDRDSRLNSFNETFKSDLDDTNRQLGRNLTEEALTEILSKITGIRTNYELKIMNQKKNLHKLLSLQEENYNLNYAGMNIDEKASLIRDQYLLIHYQNVYRY